MAEVVMTKVRIPLAKARAIVEELMEFLGPACERMAVAGSVRRQSPTVGDLDLVVIPRRVAVGDGLFGQTVMESALDARLQEGYAAGLLAPDGKDGEKYKRLKVKTKAGGAGLDLWITSPECWGVIYMIRSGPEEFNKILVLRREWGGLLPDDCCMDKGRIWRECEAGKPGSVVIPGTTSNTAGLGGHYEALDTPEERDVLALCGLPWLEAFQRHGGLCGK